MSSKERPDVAKGHCCIPLVHGWFVLYGIRLFDFFFSLGIRYRLQVLYFDAIFVSLSCQLSLYFVLLFKFML